MAIKPLKTVFEREEFIQHLVKRTRGKAIYDICYEGRVLAYEVIKVRICSYPIRKNGQLERVQYEKYPSDEEFGRYGWGYAKYEDAIRCYDSI